MSGRGGFGATGWRFVFLGFMGKREVSVRASVDGQMGANLADDHRAPWFAGLGEIDAKTFIRRAIALADMGPDTVVRTLVAYVVLLGVALHRIRGRVRGIVMRPKLP